MPSVRNVLFWLIIKNVSTIKRCYLYIFNFNSFYLILFVYIIISYFHLFIPYLIDYISPYIFNYPDLEFCKYHYTTLAFSVTKMNQW